MGVGVGVWTGWWMDGGWWEDRWITGMIGFEGGYWGGSESECKSECDALPLPRVHVRRDGGCNA